MPDGFTDIFKRINRRLRMTHVNRNLLVFLIFLAVATVFWFLQTFREYTNTTISYEFELTGIPKNVIITSQIPTEVPVTINGRGFDLLEFATKSTKRRIVLDYSDLEKADGLIVIDNNTWRKAVTPLLNKSVKFVSVSPSTLEIFFSTGAHRYVPIRYEGDVSTDANHLVCGMLIEPEYVDIYAPPAQFDTISAIYVQRKDIGQITDTMRLRLPLAPPKGVKCSVDSADVTICVDLFTNKTLTLPIYSENTPENTMLRTFPLTANVTFRVSATKYKDIKADDFALVVDYASIKAGDSQCKLIMRSKPEGISHVSISPQKVDYIIEQE